MKSNIRLVGSEQTELKKRKKEEKNIKIYRRYQYLELSSRGMTNLEIAEILDVTNDTLTDWRRLFLGGGFDGIAELHYDGRRPAKLDKYREQIREYVQKENISKITVLQSWIETQFGIYAEESWLYRYCKKNSVFPIKKPDLSPENRQRKKFRKPPLTASLRRSAKQKRKTP